MIIGLILVAAALWLAQEIKNLLIGESADQELVQGIRKLVDAYPEMCEIEEITTLHMGPEYVLVNMRVKFTENISAHISEQATHDLEQQIQSRFPLAKTVYVKAAVRLSDRQQGMRLISQRVGVE
jgi:divalent metal cation (Fe/Co/Zn/Cd) transporter